MTFMLHLSILMLASIQNRSLLSFLPKNNFVPHSLWCWMSPGSRNQAWRFRIRRTSPYTNLTSRHFVVTVHHVIMQASIVNCSLLSIFQNLASFAIRIGSRCPHGITYLFLNQSNFGRSNTFCILSHFLLMLACIGKRSLLKSLRKNLRVRYSQLDWLLSPGACH
jgi:hypothetical protein